MTDKDYPELDDYLRRPWANPQGQLEPVEREDTPMGEIIDALREAVLWVVGMAIFLTCLFAWRFL